MAVRRPLVNSTGRIAELPTGDALSGVVTVETPAGTVNGSNADFTISRNAALCMVIIGGQALVDGAGITRGSPATNITLAFAPDSGNWFIALLFG